MPEAIGKNLMRFRALLLGSGQFVRKLWNLGWGFRFILVFGSALLLVAFVTNESQGSSLSFGVQFVGAAVITALLAPRLPLLQVGEEERLPTARILKKIASAQYVCILDIWLKTLVLKEWDELKRSLESALHSGADIRILMLRPRSPLAEQRVKELESDGESNVREGMEECARRLHDFYETRSEHDRKRLQIRVQEARIPAAIHRIDDEAYWCFFPSRFVSADGPQMKVKWDGPVGEYLRRTFDELWRDAGRIMGTTDANLAVRKSSRGSDSFGWKLMRARLLNGGKR
jgi:hypothetical protein